MKILVTYLKPRDQFLRKTLQAIKKGEVLQDTAELAKQSGSHYLPAVQELSKRYHELDLDDALSNTGKIASLCNAKVIFQTPVLPKYKQKNLQAQRIT